MPRLHLAWTAQSGHDIIPALRGLHLVGTQIDKAMDSYIYYGRALADVSRTLGPPRRHIAQNGWDWKLPERDNEKLSLRAGVPKPQAADKYWSLAC